MNIINIIQKWKEFRSYEQRASLTVEELLLQSALTQDGITKQQALSIPSVSACVDLITGIVGSLNVKLYKETEGKTEEIKDNRVFLLNKNTGDTLNPSDFKKAMLTDYLLEGKSYAYINKTGIIKSLNYIENSNISIFKGVDPILKDFDIYVNGVKYLPFQFIKLLRNTRDGCTGLGIIQQSNNALNVVYLTQEFEKILLKTGGNKRGFLRASNKLGTEELAALKTAWSNLYKDNTESVVILNNGMEFTEAQSSSVELQLNERKATNNAEICKLFNIPTGLLEGNISEQEYNSFIKTCILPLLSVFECALNSSLLAEKEKVDHYFQFDTNDLLKGSLLQRYQAYQVACTAGFITKNEIRNKENLEKIKGLDIVSMNLADVIFDTKTGKYFTPNMGTQTDLTTTKDVNTGLIGGDNVEN